MKENPYFTEKEFDCKCGKCKRPENVPNDELVDSLVKIREHFNQPIIISSGYRCPTHNKKVGGASKSQHTCGSAVDFTVKNVKTEEVHKFVLKAFPDGPYGIAIKHNFSNDYAGFVHLDYGYRRRFWTYA